MIPVCSGVFIHALKVNPGAFRSINSFFVDTSPPFPSKHTPKGSMTHPLTNNPQGILIICFVHTTRSPCSNTFISVNNTIPTSRDSKFNAIP